MDYGGIFELSENFWNFGGTFEGWVNFLIMQELLNYR